MGRLFAKLFGKEEREVVEYDEYEEDDKHEAFVNSLRDTTSSSSHLIQKIKKKEMKISELSDNDLDSLIMFYKKKFMYN